MIERILLLRPGDEGWAVAEHSRARRRRLSAVAIFVLGVVLSVLTNIATGLIDPGGFLKQHSWVLVVAILTLALVGAALTWRYEDGDDTDATAGSRVSVKRAQGPVIGHISGGDVRFGERTDHPDR